MTPKFLDRFANADVADLFLTGNITATVDSYGNLNLISNFSNISSSIVGFPLENLMYNTDYVNTFYDSEFTEFTSTVITASAALTNQTTYLQSQLSTAQQQLSTTQTSLNNALQQNTQVGQLQSYVSASMDTVISLRIQLGQGSSSADFETTYPWRPVSSLSYYTGSATTV